MNKILIGILALIVLGGCDNKGDCYIGFFPSDADIAYCSKYYSEQGMKELETCIGSPGHYWSNEEGTCKQMEETQGCHTLEAFDRLEVINLPIGYENLTNHYDDDYLVIDIWCGGELLKPYNTNCSEYISKTNEEMGSNYFEGISHYRIHGGYKLDRENKTIILCWR